MLNAANIRIDTGAIFHHRGGTLVNSGMLTLANGVLDENVSQAQFGKVMLGQGTNSQIYLPGGSCVLRFGNSSTLTWSNHAVLVIDNWNGSLSGGGNHQIYFGNNTFQVFTINAKATPTPGETNVFLKSQSCSPSFRCN